MQDRPVSPRGWLIDIEGVLVRDKRYQPVPGSVAWLNGLARAGAPFCLVSNNTTHRPGELIDALRQVGYELEQEDWPDIVCSCPADLAFGSDGTPRNEDDS